MTGYEKHLEHLKVCRYTCFQKRYVCSVCKTIVGPLCSLKNGACHLKQCQAAVVAQES